MSALWNNKKYLHDGKTDLEYAISLLAKGVQLDDVVHQVNEHFKHAKRNKKGLYVVLHRRGTTPVQILNAAESPKSSQRRKLKGEHHTLPKLFDVNSQINSDNVLAYITRSNQQYRDKLRITNRKLRELVREKNSFDNLSDVFVELLDPIPDWNLPEPLIGEKDAEHKEALLQISDIHAGELIKPSNLLVGNKFNYDVIAKYFASLEAQVIDLMGSKLNYNIDVLNVVITGDLVSGIIHDDLIETAEGTVVEASLIVGRFMATLISRLARCVKQVNVTGVVGNHGRLVKSKVHKNKWADWDMIAMKMTQTYLSNITNVSIKFPPSAMVAITVGDCNYIVVHGDTMRGAGTRKFRDALTRINTMLINDGVLPAKHIITGHVHDAQLTEGVVVSGGWPGLSEYSVHSFYHPVSATQNFFIGEKHGPGLNCQIKLDNFPENMEDVYDIYMQTIVETWEHLDETVEDNAVYINFKN